MACEACSVKFNLFKRKKQCTDCLRYFCIECVIKRSDKIFSCDNCSMLSRRPLIRSQVMQMRTKDLRHYLIAKKISIMGCIEKEDLANLLMVFANGIESNCFDRRSAERPHVPVEDPTQSTSTSFTGTSSMPQSQSQSQSQSQPRPQPRSQPESPEGIITIETDSPVQLNVDCERVHDIEIEEVSEGDNSLNDGPEPLISDQDEVVEALDALDKHEVVFTEIPTHSGIVKLSDINELSELEFLTIKQLKQLLVTNRVDYKGCVEKCELLDRVSRLWEEHKQSRTDIENLDKEDLCKICWDAPIECVILECGHMACCINCGKQMSECPICKRYVVRVVRCFKA